MKWSGHTLRHTSRDEQPQALCVNFLLQATNMQGNEANDVGSHNISFLYYLSRCSNSGYEVLCLDLLSGHWNEASSLGFMRMVHQNVSGRQRRSTWLILGMSRFIWTPLKLVPPERIALKYLDLLWKICSYCRPATSRQNLWHVTSWRLLRTLVVSTEALRSVHNNKLHNVRGIECSVWFRREWGLYIVCCWIYTPE